MPPHAEQHPAETLSGTVSGSNAPAAGERYAPGLHLMGRYRIERFLGAGGMGDVYEAEDLLLRVRVALKFVRAAGDAAGERFRQEIQLARRVTHPNVCRIFDV